MTARREKHSPAPAAPVTRVADGEQLCLFGPDAAAVVHLARENLRLLHDLVARFEVSRVVRADDVQHRAEIRNPAGVVQLLGAELAALQQEQLRVVLLDAKNRVLGTSLVYQGGLSTTVVASLADFFREAVRRGAAAIILCHNHPSGDPSPSPEDICVTSEVGRAGELLGIDVLDHIILGHNGRHVSLREQGLYTCPPPRGSGAAAAPGTAATAATAPTAATPAAASPPAAAIAAEPTRRPPPARPTRSIRSIRRVAGAERR